MIQLIYDKKIERYFKNDKELVKKIGIEKAKQLKKRINQLNASNTFMDFLNSSSENLIC